MRYEYAILTWVSDRIPGSCGYSHRPEEKKVQGPLSAVLHRFGEDGWQLVGVTRMSVGNLESKHYFQRPLST